LRHDYLSRSVVENVEEVFHLKQAVFGKIRAVETVLQLGFRLKQTVGSRALMIGSGFENMDGMQVAKFAEGESSLLMQRIARDTVKATAPSGISAEEAALRKELASAKPAEWIAKTDKVYYLAELVMDRTMEQWTGKKLPRGIARPFAAGIAARL